MEPSPSSPLLVEPPEPPFDGDPAWRVTRELRDGTKITIRPISPGDGEELRRGFSLMSPRSRYLRFLGVTNVLSDRTIKYLTLVDQKDHVALVATVTSPDLKTEHGIGVARYIRLEDAPDSAEAAITVIDEFQQRGVGTALAVELGRAARALGVHTIRAEVLADNEMMRTILDAVGARRVEPTSGGGVLSYDITLGPEALSERLKRVLRGAAQTFGLTLRRLLPPHADV